LVGLGVCRNNFRLLRQNERVEKVIVYTPTSVPECPKKLISMHEMNRCWSSLGKRNKLLQKLLAWLDKTF
jgi:hypothetical protein